MKHLQFLQWLNTPCDIEQSKVHPEHGGRYLPIEVILEKFEYMREHFCVMVNRYDLHHVYFTVGHREYTITSTLNVDFVNYGEQPLLTIRHTGTATFKATSYNQPNLGGVGKSLATANAVIQYPQFGSLLNLDQPEELPSTQVNQPFKNNLKIPGELEWRSYLLAVKGNDVEKVLSLSQYYDFTDTTHKVSLPITEEKSVEVTKQSRKNNKKNAAN